MDVRFPRFTLLVPILMTTVVTACGGEVATPTSPTAGAGSSPLSAEPSTAHPEFVPGACVERQPFGVRVTIVFTGGEDLILRALRFDFSDRFGRASRPDVISVPTSFVDVSTIPSSSPIPIPGAASLPGASPVPIPGSTPILGLLLVKGASDRLPFFLKFGCGVAPEGWLTIHADGARRTGAVHRSVLSVRVGS